MKEIMYFFQKKKVHKVGKKKVYKIDKKINLPVLPKKILEK